MENRNQEQVTSTTSQTKPVDWETYNRGHSVGRGNWVTEVEVEVDSLYQLPT